MPNIMSYLSWRGDLSFNERQFNDIDNLILSALSYIDFKDIVPSLEKKHKNITIEEAAKIYFDSSRQLEEARIKRVSVVDEELLKALAITKRFKETKLSHFIDVYEEENQIQFSALRIELSNSLVYLSYRGTDKSLVGWQEDFAMGHSVVPSQEMALNYLNVILNQSPDKTYVIGGHSKGGNLAMYAAMMCSDEFRKKIIAIYNNDGPGFSDDLNLYEQFKKIQHKTFRIIPEFSVVGMLFAQDIPYKIVESSAQGFMQHDLMSWEVQQDSFIEKKALTPRCIKLNNLFDEWIKGVDIEHREIFTQDFFQALNTKGTGFVQDITAGGLDNFEEIIIALSQSDQTTKAVMKGFISTLTKRAKNINLTKMVKDKSALRGALFAIFGIFFMQTPENALRFIGNFLYVGLLGYTGFKMIQIFIRLYKKEPIKKISTILYSLGFAIAGLF